MLRPWLPLAALAALCAAAFAFAANQASSPTLHPLASTGTWHAIGPAPVRGDPFAGNVSGRVTSIAVAPGGTIYAGAASGGVWSSANGGKSWRPLTDNQPDLAIGALALDPRNPQVIYAATGENDDCGDCFYSDGVLRSENAGKSWQLLGRSTFYGHYLSSILVDPQQPQRLYVAGDLGVVRSNDGGVRWHTVLREPTTDIVFAPGRPQVLFAGVMGVGVEESLDGGNTWQRLSGGLPNRRSLIGRISLAIAPSDPKVMYAAYAGLRRNCQDCLLGLYATHDAGRTWTKLKVKDYFREPGTPISAQGDYDNVLAVSPANPNVLFAGGVDLLATANGGKTWTDLVRNYYLHTDQHALVFAQGNLYIGNDGGVYELTPAGRLLDLNTNLSITQVYQGVAVSPHGKRILAGFQDNGTALYHSATGRWTSEIDGDGAYNLILPGKHGALLGEVDGQLQRSSDRGARWRTPKLPGHLAGPMASDPIAPGDVLLGEANVWQSTNGGGRWVRRTRVQDAGPLGAIAVAPSNPEVVYAGWQNGLLEMSQNGGRSWRDIGPAAWPTACPPGPGAVPDLNITGISVSQADPYRVFVALAYSYPQSLPDCPFILETPSANASWPAWVNIAGNLPSFAVNDVLAGPSGLYAALGRGVFYSAGADSTWRPLGKGLPNVEVTGLTQAPRGALVAATYGRGVWVLPAHRDGRLSVQAGERLLH